MNDRHDTSTTIYQLAGIDDRERGFTRQVHIRPTGDRIQAVLHYETVSLEGHAAETEEAALSSLVQTLQARGYTQLRTQRIFRAGQYLGSREPWTEYADPQIAQPLGWFHAWVNRIFRRTPPSSTDR